MGNSGSAHNLNSGRSGLDRNSHFQTNFHQLSQSSHRQYHLSKSGFTTSPINPHRSYNTEWRRSYPSTSINKESKSPTEIPFKVLPELDKRLHLRATTNGAILNSGGTISGRKLAETQGQSAKKSNSNGLNQRGQTFIIETANDGNSKNDLHTEFQRSQTLLHVKARIKDSDSNLSRMQRHTYSEPELINKLNQQSLNQSASKNMLNPPPRPGNRNKYSKKRRAPDAPPTLSIATPPIRNNNDEILRNNPNLTDYTKPVHFTKNPDRSSKIIKQTAKSAQNQSETFKRGNEKRNSINGNHLQSSSNLNEYPKFAYRREKSSDAIMLKSRKSEKIEAPSKIPVNKDYQQKYNNQVPIINPTVIPPTKKDEVDKVIVSVQANKTQRTFYFGMELDTPSEIVQPDMVDEKLANDETSLPITSSYDMEYKNKGIEEENMNDNGLHVRIRPTLPRRQIETPSFSPTMAWRSLMEELERMDKSDINKNLNIWKANVKIEKPIEPNRTLQIRQVSKSNHKLPTWTPEQDLGDENDDRVKGLSTEDDSSSDEYRSKCEGDGLLFYGSKSKKSSQDAVTPIHTFSLSLPRDAHLQHTVLSAGDVCIYKSLQKSKPDSYFNNNADSHAVSNNCVTKFEGSNNWMLHKNVSGMELNSKSLEFGSKRQRLVSIEPQSIKFLTGGKHVMYLPVSNDQSNSNPNPLKNFQPEAQAETPTKLRTNRHFKSRQRHIPQSLQDKTPIFPNTSMNEQNLKLDDDKPFHQRFSFNNPVRLLEKKLYTDKSTKVAKIKMSLEGELEALKKVEEDFQRNRANEKENIQHQLRLHFGTDNEHFEQYHSLPIAPVLDRFSAINLNDANNPLFCRDDPEGCVSNVPYAVNESEEHKKSFAANNI